jgi:hypothetical protein
VPRRYQNQKEAEQETLEIIGKMPHRRVSDGDFVMLYSDPAMEIKKAKGCSWSHAQEQKGKLRQQGLLIYVANGGERRADGRKGHAWLFHLPKASSDSDSEPQLSLAAEAAQELDIAEINTLFREVAAEVNDLRAENSELRESMEETEALRAENTILEVENKSLKAQIEQLKARSDEFIRTLGRLDLDLLRNLIKNAQETREG